jgi:hemolysin III
MDIHWLHFRDPTNAWTHLVWTLLAIPGTMLLCQRARGDRPKQLSLLVFGLGMIACFGFSTLYHALPLPIDQLELFLTLDHAGIYLLIAASGTGIGFTLLRGRTRWAILGGVWLAAVVGILGRVFLVEPPRFFNTAIYLAMGWGLASSHPGLVKAVGGRPVCLVWLGGLFYTIGAAFFIARWPVGWPGLFGYHELLHIFDMLGSGTHYWFVLKYVVPFVRNESPVPSTEKDLVFNEDEAMPPRGSGQQEDLAKT